MSTFILWVAGWFVASAMGAGATFLLLSRLRTPDVETKTSAQIDPNKFRLINRWVAENPWYSDPELSKYAQQIHVQLAVEQPDLSLEDNLAMVRYRMRSQFPTQCWEYEKNSRKLN